MKPEFSLLGDHALLVTLSHEVSVETNDLVLDLSRAVESAGLPGVDEAQPAYASFCVHFDPARIRASYIETFIRQLLEGTIQPAAEVAPAASIASPASPSTPAPRQVDIPVVYGSDEGPDLQWSAEYLHISLEELVRRHSSSPYRVFMVGFTPGFPYLGGMDESIALPRLPQPRAKVPAGSVGIGGSQTGVYPWETPGGWRILGRTGVEMFSPYRDDPSLLHPGDTVRFVPVERGMERVPLSGGGTGDIGAAGADTPRAPSVPSLFVQYPGFLTMVVDAGRFGFRKLGVPVSGAADPRSYRLANQLCGNSSGEAALEMTLLGARMRALTDLTVAVTGALAPVAIDGRQVAMDQPLFLPRGSLIEIGSFRTGCRAYMAVAGGIDVPVVMGSRTTYARGKFGGYQGRYLKANDTLPAGPAPEHSHIAALYSPEAAMASSLTGALGAAELVLRVAPGPESEPAAFDALCSDSYVVNPESDRMGLRFAGRAIADSRGDILSSPVVPGVIQVPSEGKPLLLFCEAQTTGGYRRMAMVAGEDLSLAGQLRPGARVAFRPADSH